MVITREETSEIVFQTVRICISQCDDSASFKLQLFDEEIELKLCGLLNLRRKVLDLDLSQILLNTGPSAELIYLPQCDRFFLFSIEELIELNEAFSGAMAMLQLNSQLRQQMTRKHF